MSFQSIRIEKIKEIEYLRIERSKKPALALKGCVCVCVCACGRTSVPVGDGVRRSVVTKTSPEMFEGFSNRFRESVFIRFPC